MIYVSNNQSKIDIKDEQVKLIEESINKALLEEEVLIPYEVSLVFVDNEEIRDINRDNRGIDRETDVLSFPMLDYEDKKVYKQCYKET